MLCQVTLERKVIQYAGGPLLACSEGAALAGLGEKKKPAPDVGAGFRYCLIPLRNLCKVNLLNHHLELRSK